MRFVIWLQHLSLAILAVSAVVVTGLLVRRELFLPQRPQPGAPVYFQGWRELVSGNQILGSTDGQDTIVVFSDYECPFCRRLFDLLDDLLDEGNDFTIVHRNFPLSFHLAAREAAIASLCAAAVGDFEAYHRKLFASQDTLAKVSWSLLASDETGVNLQAFNDCLGSPVPVLALKKDSLAGQQLELPGTPLLFVNGWRVEGAPTPALMRELLERGRSD